MKKAVFMVVPIVVLILLFLVCAYDNSSADERKLFCNKDGNFTILVVSDPQCDTEKQWLEAKNELETLIIKSSPDFVLINGDMNSKNEIPYDMWKNFIYPITSRGLFWSTTNGNHDIYTDENYKMYKSYDGCLNAVINRGNPYFEKERPMNYIIPIYSSDGKDIVFAIYGMDSGGSDEHGYEGVTTAQIRWYTQQSDNLKKQNEGKAVTSLMCMHIPITQTLDMFYSNIDAHEATPKKAGKLYTVYGITNQYGSAVRDYYCQNGTHISETFIHTTAPQNDRGVFEKILSQGDVKIMIFGHEHNTNLIGNYKGVLLGFAGKLSSGCYSDGICRGGRVINFNEKSPENFTTQWIGALSSSPYQAEIYADATVVK